MHTPPGPLLPSALALPPALGPPPLGGGVSAKIKLPALPPSPPRPWLLPPVPTSLGTLLPSALTLSPAGVPLPLGAGVAVNGKLSAAVPGSGTAATAGKQKNIDVGKIWSVLTDMVKVTREMIETHALMFFQMQAPSSESKNRGITCVEKSSHPTFSAP